MENTLIFQRNMVAYTIGKLQEETLFNILG